jgi:hypothetical protein
MGVGSSQWKPWVLDEADSKPLLERCLDLGITFYDMADWYSTGESEEMGLDWGYGADYGITGNGGMTDMARYVAVAPQDVSSSLQYLDFEL